MVNAIMVRAPLYLTAMSEWIGNLNKNAMGPPVKRILKSAFGQDLVSQLASLLLSSNGMYTSAFDYAGTVISKVITPFSIALVMTFFIIHLMSAVSKDALTMQTLVKSLIALVIVVTLTSNSTTITRSILKMGDKFTRVTTGKVGLKKNGKGRYVINDKADGTKQLYKTMDKAGDEFAKKYGPLSLYMILFLWASAKISQIGIFVAVVSRGIEFILQAVFLPIGLANTFEGGNSPGIRYLKSFLSTALSGAVMLVIVVVGQNLTLGILTADTHQSVNRMMQYIMACGSLGATAKMAIHAAYNTRDLIS